MISKNQNWKWTKVPLLDIVGITTNESFTLIYNWKNSCL